MEYKTSTFLNCMQRFCSGETLKDLAEDTGIDILLLYEWSEDYNAIYPLTVEPKKKKNKLACLKCKWKKSAGGNVYSCPMLSCDKI